MGPEQQQRSDAVIMVIDDNADNVELATRILQRAGYPNVVGITDPRGAEEEVARVSPDLVLVDLRMPHLDGLAVIERVVPVLSLGAHVLLVTGEVDHEVRKEALARGAGGVVTKPFDITELLATVAVHLGPSRSVG